MPTTRAERALCKIAGLVPLVQLLCAEMEHAFEARSMTCPPWRQAKAMLSKWRPAKVRSSLFWYLHLLIGVLLQSTSLLLSDECASKVFSC